MYPITDKSAAILRVQRYLVSALADEGVFNPIDGVYGEDTRDAVVRFQEKVGLLQTGIVDEETFSLLYRAYIAAEQENDTSDGLYPSEILKRGDTGEEVRRLNSYLFEIFQDERASFFAVVTDEFDGVSEDAVRRLQKKWNEPETGEANRPFRRRLQREVDARNQRTNRIYTA